MQYCRDNHIRKCKPADRVRVDVSVVIPALNPAQYLSRLLVSIESQTVLPLEIVMVHVGDDRETTAFLSTWSGAIPVVVHSMEFAYPGHARNAGVGLARGEWIAFLDCRTIPVDDWLAQCMSVASTKAAGIVKAITVSRADTYFKKLVLAATYGNEGVISVAGSLVSKRAFENSGGFIPSVRAGEDIEWLGRLAASGVATACVSAPVVTYEGFPPTLGAAFRKWYEYALSSANINVAIRQKLIYSGIFCGMLALVYNWNFLFAKWKEDSIWYVPNITKVFLALTAVLYVTYRGFFGPLRRKVEFRFLVPWGWLPVCFVGFCLDVAKVPGLLLGATILIRKHVTPPYSAIKVG